MRLLFYALSVKTGPTITCITASVHFFFVFVFCFDFLTKISEQHKERILVVVSFFVSDAFCLYLILLQGMHM